MREPNDFTEAPDGWLAGWVAKSQNVLHKSVSVVVSYQVWTLIQFFSC